MNQTKSYFMQRCVCDRASRVAMPLLHPVLSQARNLSARSISIVDEKLRHSFCFWTWFPRGSWRHNSQPRFVIELKVPQYAGFIHETTNIAALFASGGLARRTEYSIRLWYRRGWYYSNIGSNFSIRSSDD